MFKVLEQFRKIKVIFKQQVEKIVKTIKKFRKILKLKEIFKIKAKLKEKF